MHPGPGRRKLLIDAPVCARPPPAGHAVRTRSVNQNCSIVPSGASYGAPRKTLAADGKRLVAEASASPATGRLPTAPGSALAAMLGVDASCRNTRLTKPSTHSAATTVIAARRLRCCWCRCCLAIEVSRMERAQRRVVHIVGNSRCVGNSSLALGGVEPMAEDGLRTHYVLRPAPRPTLMHSAKSLHE